MKKAIYFLTFASVFIIHSECKKDIASVTNIKLRILNFTPWTFYNCTVDPEGTLSDNPGPNAYNFGLIPISKTSDYQSFSKLYGYSWVKLTMNNKIYYIKPYDYTGETPLQSGKYSYKLTYTSANDQLNLELVKD